MAHDWLDCLRHTGRSGGRRQAPRIPAPSVFCSEISDDGERHAIVADVSPTGLRLLRPSFGPRDRTVQLELELPGVDELIWAKGVVCFHHVWRAGGGKVLQTNGIEIVRAAARHLRQLREYALDQAWRFGGYGERRAYAR